MLSELIDKITEWAEAENVADRLTLKLIDVPSEYNTACIVGGRSSALSTTGGSNVTNSGWVKVGNYRLNLNVVCIICTTTALIAAASDPTEFSRIACVHRDRGHIDNVYRLGLAAIRMFTKCQYARFLMWVVVYFGWYQVRRTRTRTAHAI